MTTNSLASLTSQQLRKAADLKEKIDGLENELNQMLGGSTPASPAATGRGSSRRKRSAASRARIAAAARATWARRKGSANGSRPVKAKRKFSAAARARIAAALGDDAELVTARSEGRAMSLDEAVAYALGGHF